MTSDLRASEAQGKGVGEEGGLVGEAGELEGAPRAWPASWTNFRARVFLHQSLRAEDNTNVPSCSAIE